MEWYQIDGEEVLKKLGTSEEGLSGQEAEKRLGKYGPNKLPEEKAISKLKIILHQFTSPLIYILIVAAVVTAPSLKNIPTPASSWPFSSSTPSSVISRSTRLKRA